MKTARTHAAKAAAMALLLLLCAVFGGCARAPVAASKTVMVYCMGSDLESELGMASKDIEEMLASGLDFTETNLLIMTGGATKWADESLMPADRLNIYKATKSGLVSLREETLANMGEPETLSSFLRFCYANYPANDYGLILWNHGGGPMLGYGRDVNYQKDSLTITELREALQYSDFNAQHPLAFIGFDACLMASAETAHAVSKFAAYMIASEETIPARGLNYAFLAGLNGKKMDGAALGQAAADAYISYYAEHSDSYGTGFSDTLTLSCLDLSKVSAVEAALDAMFNQIDDFLQSGQYSQIAKKRGAMQDFARFSTSSSYDLIDITELAQTYAQDCPDAAAKLISAVSDMVVYNRAAADNANGLTIYYPFNNKVGFEERWLKLYEQFQFAPAYTAFLKHFGNNLLGEELTDWSGDNAPQMTKDEETQAYYLQLNDEQSANYAGGVFYILRRVYDNVYEVCAANNGVRLDAQNRLWADFDGNIVCVVDQTTNAVYHPPCINAGGSVNSARYRILAGLQKGDERISVDIQADFSKQSDSVRLFTAIPSESTTELSTGKRDTMLTDWDYAILTNHCRYVSYDDSGTILPVPDWESPPAGLAQMTSNTNALFAEYRPIENESGTYYCQIIMEDTQGNQYPSELMPIPRSLHGDAVAADLFGGVFQKLPPVSPKTEIDVTDGGETVLFCEQGVTVSLIGTGLGIDHNHGDVKTPYLKLRIRNDSEEPIVLGCNDIRIERINADAELTETMESTNEEFAYLDEYIELLGDKKTGGYLYYDFLKETTAHDTSEAYLWMDISEREVPGLYQENIDTIENVEMQFTLNHRDIPQASRILLSPIPIAESKKALTMEAREGDGYRALPFSPCTVLEDAGFTVAAQRACVLDNNGINILLKIHSASEYFNAINVFRCYAKGTDVQAHNPANDVHIEAGETNYGWLKINYHDLACAGVRAFDAIELNFSMCQSGVDGFNADTSYLTDFSVIPLRGVTVKAVSVDLAGKVLMEQNGVTITRLAQRRESDTRTPAITLMIENNGESRITAKTEHAYINGKDTGYYGFVSNLYPGRRAFVTIKIGEYKLSEIGETTAKSYEADIDIDIPSHGTMPIQCRLRETFD